MSNVSPNPSDRELVLAVVAGKLAPEKAAELLRGNDQQGCKALILENLQKNTLPVVKAVALMNRLDQIAAEAAERKGRAMGGGSALRCKVSVKGGLSVYGLQRMPVTLYVEQWERLLAFADEIRSFSAAQNGSLSRKRPVATAAAA